MRTGSRENGRQDGAAGGSASGGEQMNTEAITSIKGIGEKTARLFQKLGVETVEDLLCYYRSEERRVRARECEVRC